LKEKERIPLYKGGKNTYHYTQKKKKKKKNQTQEKKESPGAGFLWAGKMRGFSLTGKGKLGGAPKKKKIRRRKTGRQKGTSLRGDRNI